MLSEFSIFSAFADGVLGDCGKEVVWFLGALALHCIV